MGTKITYTDAEILDIAKNQKAILWLIVANIGAYAAAGSLTVIPIFIVAILSLVVIYKLAVALRASAPALYVVLGLIPCISLIALVVINSQATTALKSRGIRVGLMGANEGDLKKISSPAD